MVITMDGLTAKDIEILKSELTQLKKQRNELDSQIEALNDKRDEINKECDTRERKIESYNLLHSLENVNDNNSMTVFLRSNTQTTALMDEFYHSDRDFLILKWNLVVPKSSYFDEDIYGDLVIVKYNYSLGADYSLSNLTITDLKKKNIINQKFAVEVIKKYLETPGYKTNSLERYYPLCQEIDNIFKQKPKHGDKFEFSCPVYLGAQIYEDQENFGIKDYDYGTLYGQTTTFLIIGAIFN